MSLSLKELKVIRQNKEGSSSHTIISPLALQGSIVRTLDSASPDVPNVAIEMNIDDINVSVNPVDYNEIFNFLEELPTLSSSDTQSAESKGGDSVKSLSKTEPATPDTTVVSSVDNKGRESPSDFKLTFKLLINSLVLSVESDMKKAKIVSVTLTSLQPSIALDPKFIKIGFL